MVEPALSPAQALKLWRLYFSLAVLQGGLAVWGLLQGESESEAALVAGISASRLVLIGLVLVFLALFVLLLGLSWRSPERVERRVGRVAAALRRPAVWGTALVVLGLVTFSAFFILTLVPEVTEPFTRGLLDRAQPLVGLLAGLALQSLLALPLLRYGLDWDRFRPRDRSFVVFLALLGLLFVLWEWVARYRLEVESQIIGWNSLGVPLLETQLIFGVLAGLGMLALVRRGSGAGGSPGRLARWLVPPRLDWLLAVLIWLLAVGVWTATPLAPNWFVSQERPPNFEPYPNSDALGYDLSAQAQLVGRGFVYNNTPFIRRPLYSFLLSAFHLLGGQDYRQVVFVQVLLLALLPVFLYLLGKRLHSRTAGVIAAVFVLLRESNSITIADTITISHAKALMSDLPAALCVAALVYFSVAWLQEGARRRFYPLLVGALLGAGTLIRIEIGFLLFPLVLVSLLALRRRAGGWRLWGQGVFLFILGLLLFLAPWVYRNYSLTGLVFIDSPSFRFELFAQRYQSYEGEPASDLEPPIDEGAAQNAEPAPTAVAPGAPVPTASAPPAGENYLLASVRRVLAFAGQNAGQVAGFLTSHYANSQVQFVLLLPGTVRVFDSTIAFAGHRLPDKYWFECCSTLGYARRLPYWHKWDGVFPSQATLLLVANVLFLAAGLSRAWDRDRWVGMAPAFVALGHLLVNALVRNSGGRYILPADWVSLLYYAIGWAVFLRWLVRQFGDRPVALDFPAVPAVAAAAPARPLFGQPAFYLWAGAVLLAGSALPLAERLAPPIYTAGRQAVLLENLLAWDDLDAAAHQGLQEVLASGGQVQAGRALFPRFYPAERGEPGSRNPMGPLPYPRLGFYLVGAATQPVLLPLRRAPETFPNASDALVVRCPDGEAAAVAVFDPAKAEPLALLTRGENPANLSCPLPPIQTTNE